MLTAIPVLRLLTPDEAVVETTYQVMAYFVPFYLKDFVAKLPKKLI